MLPERKLADSLKEAADALRAIAEAEGRERERSAPEEPHREHHCCFDSRHELVRLGKALLEAVEIVKEAVRECSSKCDHDESCEEHEHCAAAPPPYPPYPPNPPYAPYPPYPPYPPVIVIGGGCGCGCSGNQAGAPSVTVAQPPSTAAASPQNASAGAAPLSSSPIPTSFFSALSPLLSARAGEFPEPAGIRDAEALLDIGESAAALVRRTLAQSSGGPAR